MGKESPINGTLTVPNVATFGKIYHYPDGSRDIIAADRPTFRAKGWEPRGADKPEPRAKGERSEPAAEPKPENLERAARRAKAKVRRLALANQFRWFVTLTYDPQKVDSLNPAEAIRRMGQWCSNQVKRGGLRYVLVPELHKSGRVHLHGFFSDSVEAVDSGHRDKSGHPIFNLPGWGYGFTTAIELYGDYHKAVAYVCKYIGKDGKIGGRWYYSGGKLAQPREEFVDISANDIARVFEKSAWVIAPAGRVYAGVNGLRSAEDDERTGNQGAVGAVGNPDPQGGIPIH